MRNELETQIATRSAAERSVALRVAAVQLGIYPNDLDRAVAEAEVQVREASRNDARLVCLPEHWLLSWVLTGRDTIIQRFESLAKELDVYLNLGANYERRGGRTWLTSHTLSPSGKIISRQDKVHLYRREAEHAVPGTRFQVAVLDGFKVAVLVCHDAVFPETARAVTLMGAELLVIPSLIAAKGSEPWLAYLRARSLENRVPIVSPNVYHPAKFMGRSCIIDLRYDRKEHLMHLVERQARPLRTALVTELDIGSKRPYRRERLRELLRSNALRSLYSASKAVQWH